VLGESRLARVVNEAEVRRLTNSLSFADLVERHPHRRGIRTARAVLATLRAGTGIVRSELEAQFHEFVRSRGLPPPQLNAPLLVHGSWIECDCVWRRERLIAELDGRAVHGTSAVFERDRERDRMLQAAGWRVIRITWRQLHEEAEVVAADLRKIIVWVRAERDRPALAHPARTG